MFRRDDAPSATETEQASDSYPADTSSGENASTLPPATTDTPSPAPVPSSTGRGLMVVETSTPLESHSLSTPSADPTLSQSDTPTLTSATTAGSNSADIPSSTTLFYSSPASSSVYSILPESDPPISSGFTSADIPSSTMLFYSSPASSSVYSILPESDVAPTPTSSSSASADIPPSTTLFYSIVTAVVPIPTIAPASVSPWYSILPVSDTETTSSASSYPTSPFTSLFYSIVTAADPSISPWYSILPVSDTTTISSAPSSTTEDTIPSSTTLFYSIVTAADPILSAAPASISPLYSILPVSDITTISVSSSSTSADTSIPSSTALHSIVTAADPTLTSILRVSDTTTISTSLSLPPVLPVSESTTPDLVPESTLVYSILPVSDPSTRIYSTLRLLDTSTPTAVPTSTLIFPVATPTTGPSKSTSNYPVAITTDTPAKDAYHSTTVTTTLDKAQTTSSQRINNLALQPTADPGSSTVLVTSGSITRTFVVRPTGGITGVGGTDSGSGEGPSSGDTRSHHALPISIILGSVLAGVILILGLVVFVVRRRRRRRVARWHRLPYEPALDTSRHSSRFLNPFTDIDDDWSIIASEVERPVSTTTTSTLAFAPSREDGDNMMRTPLRSGGWMSR
ncbi:hypothetical protein ARMGADRAFT_235931 [Armillaria gallica]|uniref:Uncharacterized protein n=1 Tax=Armillaria gallica TaxID=47427 RepID=A0A2H3EGI9_ARMGA|nr:hypothetical protein ARMGADRAFT_235931 [Armillaria gallica]